MRFSLISRWCFTAAICFAFDVSFSSAQEITEEPESRSAEASEDSPVDTSQQGIDFEKLQNSAELHLMNRDSVAALAETAKVLEQDPRNVRALAVRALAHLRQDLHEASAEDARKILSIDKGCTDVAHYVLACLSKEAGKYAEAIDHCTKSIKAMESPSGLLEAYLPLLHRADARFKREDFQEALADSREALQVNPTNKEPRFVILLSLVKLKRTEEARCQAVLPISDYPEETSMTHSVLAAMYWNLDQLSLALEEFNDAIDSLTSDQESKLWPLLMMKARCLILVGDLEGALECLNWVTAGNPECSKARMLRLFLLLELSLPYEAVEDAEYLVESNPYSVLPALLCVDVYAAIGDYEKAHLFLEKAASVAGSEQVVFLTNLYRADLLATTPLEEKRDGERALELSKAACERTNWRQAFAIQAYAAACAETGDFEEAIYWQERILVMREESDTLSTDSLRKLNSKLINFDVVNRNLGWVKFPDEHEAQQRLECYRDHRPYRAEMSEETLAEYSETSTEATSFPIQRKTARAIR